MSFRSCHCCQEPGRVFVWIVSAMTVTKVVEGCVYIRRRYYGILPRVGGEFEHSALSPLSLRSLSDLSVALSSNATTLNHLIRLQGSQGIQIWKQRTCTSHPAVAGRYRSVAASLSSCSRMARWVHRMMLLRPALFRSFNFVRIAHNTTAAAAAAVYSARYYRVLLWYVDIK